MSNLYFYLQIDISLYLKTMELTFFLLSTPIPQSLNFFKSYKKNLENSTLYFTFSHFHVL